MTEPGTDSATAPVAEAAEVRVYINERGVSVAAGARAIDAVRALFPEQADAITAGTARLTDSRGLPIGADFLLHGGAIFRVLPVRESTQLAEQAE